MRRFLNFLAVAALAFGGARAAEAAITFDFSSTCDSFCGVIGLNVGDPVSGSISFNDAAIVPNESVQAAEVLSFDFDFGTVDITSATAAGFFFGGLLNATGTAFSSFVFDASEAVSPAWGETVHLGPFGFFASPAGNCSDMPCYGISVGFSAGQGFTGATLVVRQAQVPEPGTLVLFAVALAGITTIGRRNTGL